MALWALVAPLCVALLGWITLAIYFSPLEPPWMRAALAALVPIGAIIALIRVRPLRRVSSRSPVSRPLSPEVRRILLEHLGAP